MAKPFGRFPHSNVGRGLVVAIVLGLIAVGVVHFDGMSRKTSAVRLTGAIDYVGGNTFAFHSKMLHITVGPPTSRDTPDGLSNPNHQPNAPLSIIPSSSGPDISSANTPKSYLEEWSQSTGPWLTFWPTAVTSRAVSTSPSPGPRQTVQSTKPLIPSNLTWDNGGAWLDSVYRLTGSTLVGFFHAEHHYGCSSDVVRCTKGVLPDGKSDFWASGGASYSYDNGVTWSPAEQFLTSQSAQPTVPSLGGSNFQYAVWDFQRHRWVAIYGCQHGVACEAISKDPMGRPGTWMKYDNGRFDQPGLGGMETPMPGLTKDKGTLYSVSYDTAAGAWIGWGRLFRSHGVFVTLSSDLTHWSRPDLIVTTGDDRYPFLAGNHGTQVVDSSGQLFYASGRGHPTLISRNVTLSTQS
jgi:hypothetical protein